MLTYAEAVARLLVKSPGGRQDRLFMRDLMCMIDLTGEEADEVIRYGLEHGIFFEADGALRPPSG